MIPKIIHYCWIGGAPLPELAKNVLSRGKNAARIMKSRSGMSRIMTSLRMCI